MVKKIGILLIAGLTMSAALLAERIDLPPRWKDWLGGDVPDIISSKEREVFLALRTDREREAFTEAFWLQRDPTPGTPENEFKTEHYRRLKYADEHYGRSSMRRGRETDRGRMYILLGEPISVETFEEGAQNLVPCELWQYHGESSLGLPALFYLLFFKRDATGDYVLYSPSFDGPSRLIQGAYRNGYDRRSAYAALKQASGELAEASLSLIPGTGGNDATSASSLSSDLLLSGIKGLPEKKTMSDWAVAFARNSETITVDHSVAYLPSDACLFVHQAGEQFLLNAVIEPSRVSMTERGDKVVAPLKLTVRVSGADGGLVHQEEKNIPVEIARSDFGAIAGRVVAVGDILPLVDGRFVASFLLQNLASKEFSSFEEAVVTPDRGGPALSRPLILDDAKPAERGKDVAPFVFDGKKLYPNSSRTLSRGEPLRAYFEIYNPDGTSAAGTLRFSLDGETGNVARAEEPVGGRRYFVRSFPDPELPPGYYTLGISLVDASGRDMALVKERFTVSLSPSVPKPWRFDKIYPGLDHPYYKMIMAYEYLGTKDPAKAAAALEPLVGRGTPNPAVVLLLARAYFDMKQDARVLAVLGADTKTNNAEVLLLRGQALYRLSRYGEALPDLEAALRSQGQTVELLNLVGTSYLKLGKNDKGLPYLVRSLEMNPDQPEIRRAVAGLSK